MVLIVITRNCFNFSGIVTQLVSVSKNLSLVLVFSQLLGVISLSHLRFVAHIGGVVREFCFAAWYPCRRFPSVPRYMLWLSVIIFVGSILFGLCIWLTVYRLHGIIWFNCFINSRNLSSSLVTSISVTLLGVIWSLPRTQLCCFQ